MNVELKWVRPSCPICSGADMRPIARAIHKGVDLHYSLCASCCAMFQNPTIAEPALDHFYSKIYPSLYERHPDSAKLMDVQQRRANAFSDYVGKRSVRPRRVLEIGCSAGWLGRAMIAAFPGVSYQGVELDDTLAALSAEHFPVARSIDTCEPGFDLILLSHVLEHMFDPVRYMETLGRLLAPGGQIIAEVPNGNTGSGFEIAHPFIFTTPSLEKLAANAGLSLVEATEHDSYKAKTRRPQYLTATFEVGQGKPARSSLAERRRIAWMIARRAGRKAMLANAARYMAGREIVVPV